MLQNQFEILVNYKYLLKRVLNSMLTKTIKRDEVPTCRQLKNQNLNKLSDLSPTLSKSIIKIDQSSKTFFTTLVKKEHGFQGKHKQVHYQQCLLVAFQKTGVVNLGYILKNGGFPAIQNYQSFLQHSLPLTKCRDIQSISDKEIVLFFHETDQNKEWKFKFYQKEVKQKWMLLLMILAFQKQYQQSIISIFNEEMLIELSKENLNAKNYASEIRMAQYTIIDQEIIKKCKGQEDKIQVLARSQTQIQLERLRLQEMCKSLTDKIAQLQEKNLVLRNQKVNIQSKVTILQQKLQFIKINSDKISAIWLKVDHQIQELNNIEMKQEQLTKLLITKQDQFEVLGQSNDQNNQKMNVNPQKILNQLKKQVQNSLKELGLEIGRFKESFKDQTINQDI